MTARPKRTRSWERAQAHIARVRRFAEKYGLNDARPDEYMSPSSQQDDWDDLLKRIE